MFGAHAHIAIYAAIYLNRCYNMTFAILLLQAIQDNNTKVVKAWLQYNKRRPNRNRIKDRHGFAPVHYAVKFNRLQLLEDLCNEGKAGK